MAKFLSATAAIILVLAASARAEYILKQSYDASNFFNEFRFFTVSYPSQMSNILI